MKLAKPDAYLVDPVRGGCTQPAAALRRIEPPVGKVVLPRLDVAADLHEAGEARLTDGASGDGAVGGAALGREAEFIADHVDSAGLFRRRQHRARFAGVAGEGLFAEHMATGLDRLKRQRAMGVRRGRNGDDIGPGRDDRRAEIGEVFGNAVGRGALRRARRIAADEAHHVVTRPAKGGDLNAAAESGADDERTQGRSGQFFSPFSLPVEWHRNRTCAIG